jgi:lipopolysaccharide export system permease protein
MLMMQVERTSASPDEPNYTMHAKSGVFDTTYGAWKLKDGVIQLMLDSIRTRTFTFDSLLDPGLRERPAELVKSDRAPTDMGYRELGNYIRVMERAGGDVNRTRVERMHKIAIPITCIIIVLFGAPLATSNQRGGASYGIGISLAATVLFILMINLTKAIGGRGVIEPEVAAWLPSMIFGLFGLFMLGRVRT